jgi:hypothetical protein
MSANNRLIVLILVIAAVVGSGWVSYKKVQLQTKGTNKVMGKKVSKEEKVYDEPLDLRMSKLSCSSGNNGHGVLGRGAGGWGIERRQCAVGVG